MTKVVVVTGGASGIGRATVTQLQADGHHLAILDLNAEGADGLWLHADVSDPLSVEGAVARVVEHYGRIDVLVNNAGITGSQQATTCHQTPIDEWDRVLGVNLRGPFLMSRAVLPTMLEQSSGHIINIVSISGMVPTPGRCAYTASKGGALMLTKSIAIDYAASGIRANAVCPGMVQTPMTRWRLDVPELAANVESGIPLGRVAQPEEVAEVVSLLASDRLQYMTAHAWVLDGGTTSASSMTSAATAAAAATPI